MGKEQSANSWLDPWLEYVGYDLERVEVVTGPPASKRPCVTLTMITRTLMGC